MSLREDDGRIICEDCGRWARPGERIRHSTRCDAPECQPGPPAAAPAVVAEAAPVATRNRYGCYCRECGGWVAPGEGDRVARDVAGRGWTAIHVNPTACKPRGLGAGSNWDVANRDD